jgi:hypothetical protein
VPQAFFAIVKLYQSRSDYFDIDTFDFSCVFLFEGFQSKEVVSVDNHIFGGGVAVVTAAVVEQYSRLDSGFLPLAYPRQF